MVLGMGIRFSKTIANKLGLPPSGLFAMNQILDRSVYCRPLGGEPNLFAIIFENLIPIPNTIQNVKASYQVHILYDFFYTLNRHFQLPAAIVDTILKMMPFR